MGRQRRIFWKEYCTDALGKRMRRNILFNLNKGFMAAMCLSFPLLLFGCSKTDTASLINKRVASEGYGNINLSASEPIVNLNDITSYVGESIDFLSEISISCPDDKIYSLYVDATSVDIWTPGTYGATYELTVDDILYTYDVNVYIIEYVTQVEDSAADTVALDSDEAEDETVSADSDSGSDSSNSETSNSNTSNSVSSNSGSTAATTVSGSSVSGSSTTVTTTTQSSNSSNTSQTTTKASSISATTTTRATRTYVASSTTQAATETQVLNYAKVELLGGGTIQIKQTTGRYIVSTRTDITYQTSGSVTYEISKLIVTYSTGAEQTLETYKRVVSS